MSILLDYGRAFASSVPLAGKLPFLPGGGGPLPGITRQRTDVRIDPAHLAAYAKVCGYTLRDRVPAVYLNVLAFPTHIALMTDGRMPFGPVGLVHIANEVVQHRPIDVTETLALEVGISGLDPHPKGRLLTLHTTWRAGDEVVWTGASTMLRRGGGGAGGTTSTVEPLEVPEDIEPSATWRLPGDLGRRYAAVSGDRNPIHLYDITAKPFGFPRAIVHGLWTKARAVAEFDADPPDSFEVRVRFRAPILLPSTVTFGSRDGAFTVRNAKSGAPHLDGIISERTQS